MKKTEVHERLHHGRYVQIIEDFSCIVMMFVRSTSKVREKTLSLSDDSFFAMFDYVKNSKSYEVILGDFVFP